MSADAVPSPGAGGAMRPERDPERTFDEFVELWTRLLAEGETAGTVAVVEGARDLRAIRKLGWTHSVTLVHRGHPIADTARLLATARRVIVLTDWDTEGGHLAQHLREHLAAGPARLDLDYRRRLARLLRGELVHVEGLYGWARRTAERVGRPLDFAHDGAGTDGPLTG